ncbi:MAG: tetratricopeptide repeat protein [Planctomycetota bacterium]
MIAAVNKRFQMNRAGWVELGILVVLAPVLMVYARATWRHQWLSVSLRNAMVATAMGDASDALRHLDRIIEGRPGQPDALILRADLLARKSLYAKARQDYQTVLGALPGRSSRALSAGQTATVHVGLGMVALAEYQEQPSATDKAEEAGASFDKALALDPENADAEIGIGLLAFVRNNPEGAEKRLRGAVREGRLVSAVLLPRAYYVLGILRATKVFAEGRVPARAEVEEVRAFFQQARLIEPTWKIARVNEKLAELWALTAGGKDSSTPGALHEFARLAPDLPAGGGAYLYNALAVAFFRRGDFNIAKTYFDNAVAGEKVTPAIRLNQAIFLLERARAMRVARPDEFERVQREVAPMLEQILAAAGPPPAPPLETAYLLAVLLDRLGREADAVKLITRLAVESPEDPHVLSAQAVFAVRKGEMEKARGLLSKALAKLPGADLETRLQSLSVNPEIGPPAFLGAAPATQRLPVVVISLRGRSSPKPIPPSAVQVAVDDAAIDVLPAAGGMIARPSVPLSFGKHRLTVRVTDDAGNRSERALDFETVDR